MAKLPIDLSGLGGLAPKFYGDSDQTTSTPNKRYLGADNAMAEGFFNPFTRYGFMSGSVSTLGATTFTGGTYDALFGSVVYDAVNDDVYFAERGRQLFHLDGFDDTQFQQDVDLGATGTPVIMDLEIYQVNGVRKIFLVHEKSGNLEVAISSLPYNTGTDDLAWLSGTVSGSFTNSTSSNYNFMRVADNGFAYLFADNTVHKIDGTTNGGSNGTITPNAILFPPFFRIVDAIDYRGLMFIAIHQTTFDPTTAAANSNNFNTPCGIYIWDRQTTVVNTRDYIPLVGVKSIKKIYVSPKGDIRIVCIMSTGMVQIMTYSGSTFSPLVELGLGAAPQYPDSLDVSGMLTSWLGTDGTIYAHGSPTVGSPEILAKIGYVKAPSTSPATNVSTGAVIFGAAAGFSGSSGYRSDRQGFTICYNDGSLKASKFFPFDKGTINSNNQNFLQGNVFTLVKYLPAMSTVNFIDIYCAAGTSTGSTTQATIKIYLNGSATAWASKTITRDDISKGYKTIKVQKPYINSIQLKIEFASDVTTGDNYDFHPLAAIVDYTPSTDLG